MRRVEARLGILRAAFEDVTKDYLWSIRDVFRAELFDNLLDQAEHLVKNEYKDAAAVIAGSTLEEQLRALCAKHGIATTVPDKRGNPEPKPASRMDEDLAKHSVYNQIESKAVMGWQAIRNDAAHGHYGNYTQEQVKQMSDGIRGFMTRHPA